MLVLAACQGATAAPAPRPGRVVESACDSAPEGDLLATICEAGVIRVATDPAYPPQSELLPDGSFEGFDIDVANRIGEELGVEVQFETPDFAEVVAGSWAERFDISVGSVTITEERDQVLDFTVPYYHTPAQMSATTESGITSLEELAGEVICGESTKLPVWPGTLNLTRRGRPRRPGGDRVDVLDPTPRVPMRRVGCRTQRLATSITTAQSAMPRGRRSWRSATRSSSSRWPFATTSRLPSTPRFMEESTGSSRRCRGRLHVVAERAVVSVPIPREE